MLRKSLSIVVGMAILPSLAHAEAKEDYNATPDTTLTLQEVTVNANFLNSKLAPLSFTTIKPTDVTRHTSAPNFVEMLQAVPGVYATSSTGSYGDATLNMRGFKQDNIAVLLNGIPIQGLTSGSMYWSNWMALTDATYSVQVQKGIGGSLLADCAMGGMVNIITNRLGTKAAGSVSLTSTQQGLLKTTVSYSTGRLAHGWGVNGMLSWVKGDGYVQCTDVNTLSYMLTVSKSIGARHTLLFTALGSPERHNQRNTELTAREVDTYGVEYSKNWGYLRGKPFSIARNHYFKPYFTLQHLYNGEKWKWRNSLYFALADGGGYSTVSASKKEPFIQFRTSGGLLDFDAIINKNQSTTDSLGRYVGRYAMIDYLSGHTQLGGVASGDYRVNDTWQLSLGLQYQYYDTWSKMKILDLLQASYFSYYGKNYELGQYIGNRYGRTTHHSSGYVQAHYNKGDVVANLGVAVYLGAYRRHDDVKHAVSQWTGGCGVSVRGGAMWHLNKHISLYGNMGYNSRLPYAGVYLASSNLSVTKNVKNEKNILGELGLRASWHDGGVELLGYVASWRDKNLAVSLAKRANETAEKYQMSGLNALHMGVEMTVNQAITPWLAARGYAALGSWKWKSGGDAISFDSYTGEVLKQYAIYCNGLHVGDAPQSQLGLQLDAHLRNGLYARADLRYQARMYADFEPSGRTVEAADAFKLPSCALLDATVGYAMKLKRAKLDFFASCRNIANHRYIERGIDGASHDLVTFKGYWGMPRQFSFGVKLDF